MEAVAQDIGVDRRTLYRWFDSCTAPGRGRSFQTRAAERLAKQLRFDDLDAMLASIDATICQANHDAPGNRALPKTEVLLDAVWSHRLLDSSPQHASVEYFDQTRDRFYRGDFKTLLDEIDAGYRFVGRHGLQVEERGRLWLAKFSALRGHLFSHDLPRAALDADPGLARRYRAEAESYLGSHSSEDRARLNLGWGIMLRQGGERATGRLSKELLLESMATLEAALNGTEGPSRIYVLAELMNAATNVEVLHPKMELDATRSSLVLFTRGLEESSIHSPRADRYKVLLVDYLARRAMQRRQAGLDNGPASLTDAEIGSLDAQIVAAQKEASALHRDAGVVEINLAVDRALLPSILAGQASPSNVMAHAAELATRADDKEQMDRLAAAF